MNDLLAAGRVLGGRYRLVEEVARGGMAWVWVAEDPILRRRVAVKILDPTIADDDHVRQRFRHEAIAAARLTHPGIVATYDTGEDDGVAYIVMELIEGTTLRRLLDNRRTLAIGEVADIGAQVADALEHAHSRGLVHRDVKPGNVLVERDGRVKVTDFGIAKAAGASELTRSGAVVGTARYLAPEQVEGGPVDARTDVYALGLVLYEMLCGQTPFNADNEIANAVARLRADPVPVAVARPEAPNAMQDVVRRSLARDPGARPSSAGEVRDALTPFRRESVPDFGASAAFESTPRPGTVAAPVTPRITPTPDPTMPDRALVESAPHGGHRAARAIVIALLAVVGVVVLLVAFAGRGDGPGRTTGSTVGSATGSPAVALRIANVADFDPPPGDRIEHHVDVGKVADGRVDTFWSTETYSTRDFGGKKTGVGLVLQLATPSAVRTVRVQALDTDWNAAVYVLDQPPQVAPSAVPDASGQNLGVDATLTLDPPKAGRYVLLWLTRLPASGRLRIAEVGLAS
ncbi:MAG: serine/threonine protein kinase [Actinobacteria bacterium]|nr:serine/threonine protein kinase [Actinomycetota bacterium]